MVRLPSYDSNGMKKGAWSEDEDARLRAHIEVYGHRNWRLVPVYAGLARCGKSCRLRWVNYLKPGLRRGNFTQHEEDLIIELHAHLGSKWSAIAARLRGRTDNEIKNHWNAHLRKRCSKHNAAPSKSNQLSEPNLCNSATSDKYHRHHQKEAVKNLENIETNIGVNTIKQAHQQTGNLCMAAAAPNYYQASLNPPTINVLDDALPFSKQELDELLMFTNNEYSYGSEYSSSYTGLTSSSTAESQPSFSSNPFGEEDIDASFDFVLWGQYGQPLYVDH